MLFTWVRTDVNSIEFAIGGRPARRVLDCQIAVWARLGLTFSGSVRVSDTKKRRQRQPQYLVSPR